MSIYIYIIFQRCLHLNGNQRFQTPTDKRRETHVVCIEYSIKLQIKYNPALDAQHHIRTFAFCERRFPPFYTPHRYSVMHVFLGRLLTCATLGVFAKFAFGVIQEPFG